MEESKKERYMKSDIQCIAEELNGIETLLIWASELYCKQHPTEVGHLDQLIDNAASRVGLLVSDLHRALAGEDLVYRADYKQITLRNNANDSATRLDSIRVWQEGALSALRSGHSLSAEKLLCEAIAILSGQEQQAEETLCKAVVALDSEDELLHHSSTDMGPINEEERLPLREVVMLNLYNALEILETGILENVEASIYDALNALHELEQQAAA